MDIPSTTERGAAATANRRFVVAALLALFAFALAFQGSRGIWDPDEGRYTDIAIGMVRSGDWWTPRLSRELPHFSKPPLTYWAVASSITIFGRNEWAARLPNAVACCGTVLMVFALAQRLAPGREWLAATVQATALYPFVAANIVTTDTLLAFFETLALYGFVRARWDPDGARRGAFWMWTGFGLAFLTKGPPGLLPLAAIVAFLLATERLKGLRRLAHGPAIALFAVLSFGWYAAQVATNSDLLGYLLGTEVVGRLTSPKFNRNAGIQGVFHTYVPVLLAGLLPWAPWAVARTLKRLRAGSGGAEAAPRRRSPESLLLIWWTLLPLSVFLLSTSKLPLYLLPLAPPAALLVARALPVDALAPRRRRIALFVWIAMLLGIKAVSAEIRSDRDGRRLSRELLQVLPYLPRELVTINRKPLYSLVYYLDIDAKAIALDGNVAALSDPGYVAPQTLPDQLSGREADVVYLVPRSAEARFLELLAGRGWQGRQVGRLDAFAIFLVSAAPAH